mgnify:CR=1 FL=1
MAKLKKKAKAKSFEVEPVLDPGIEGFINKMLEQMSFLEKKIDTVIARLAERPPEQAYTPRPQHFERPYRRDEGRQDGGFKERTFTKVTCAECGTECEVPFKPSGDRPVYCKECFAKRKPGDSFKPRHEGGRRDEGFGPKRHFEKHHRGDDRKSGDRKRRGKKF